ncbi:TPA: Ig-like domain-containing protein [Serratia fonticola]|nr:Ig-like domain-containing protein [Serratia fonticola]HBE9093469.1 Ig-like domain-containing protein [Serratia fonticola]HBE9151664.1 Ig-like domain-containing protein [Serratia fonticola]
MTSKHEKTKGTVISVSATEASEANPTGVAWLSASCSMRELSFTGGQKSDIEITTFCSDEQEMVNGLKAPSEMTINKNWSAYDTAQDSLMEADETDTRRAIKIVFPSGNGFAYLAEVRQNSWSAATNGVVSASFSLRIIGKPVRIYAVNIPVTGVILDKTTASVSLGNSLQLTPTIAPASATNKAVTWTSSTPGNVMVTAAGVITGLAVGTSTITVKTSDGAKTATCVVTVTA